MKADFTEANEDNEDLGCNPHERLFLCSGDVCPGQNEAVYTLHECLFIEVD